MHTLDSTSLTLFDAAEVEGKKASTDVTAMSRRAPSAGDGRRPVQAGQAEGGRRCSDT